MLKQERFSKIVNILSTEEIVQVSDLANMMNVSEMTIRRDLRELDRRGKVLRVHGGAQSVSSSLIIEKNFNEKREIHVPEKKEVAKKAAKLIKDGETVYVGPGTTLEFMVAELKQKKLRLVTNSIPVFEAARQNTNNYDLILIVNAKNRS